MFKGKLNHSVVFFALIAAFFSLLFLLITHQEKLVDEACLAIKGGDQETAIEYIDKIWNINSVGRQHETVLMAACEVGSSEMIQYIINLGADVNKTSRGYMTPLELFCEYGYEAGCDTLSLILEAGVKQSNFTISPAVFYLADDFCWMTEEQKELAAKETILLLQNGAPFGYQKTSLIHLTAKADMDDLFYTLVHTKEGLNLMTMEDENGDTPWDIAIKNGSISVLRVIRNLETEYNEVLEEEAQAKAAEEGEKKQDEHKQDMTENDTEFKEDEKTSDDTKSEGFYINQYGG